MNRVIIIASMLFLSMAGASQACSVSWTYFDGQHWIADGCGNSYASDISGNSNQATASHDGAGNSANVVISGDNNSVSTTQNGTGTWIGVSSIGNGNTVVVSASN
jgi:hypothetical protein